MDINHLLKLFIIYRLCHNYSDYAIFKVYFEDKVTFDESETFLYFRCNVLSMTKIPSLTHVFSIVTIASLIALFLSSMLLITNVNAQSAVATDPVEFDCGTAEASIPAGAATITVGGSQYYIGYEQVSGINQDPVLAKFTGGVQDWCRNDYEATPVDGRGVGLLGTPGGQVYATFTVDGGNAGFNFGDSSGWLSGYGSGGGAVVSVVSLIDTSNGDATNGTFVRARLDNGDTNSLRINALQWDETNQQVMVQAASFFSPLDINGDQIPVTGSSPFDYVVVFNSTLTTAVQAYLGTFSGPGTGNTGDGGSVAAPDPLPLLRSGGIEKAFISVVGAILILGGIGSLFAWFQGKQEYKEEGEY